MFCRPPDLIICTCFVATIGIIYLVTQSFQLAFSPEYGHQDSSSPTVATFRDSWVFRLVQNLLGYSIVVAPGALILMYVRKTQYLERAYTGCFPRLIRLCFHGADPVIGAETVTTPSPAVVQPPKTTVLGEAFLVLFCFFGLQFSYLTWGVLQEKIMTQVYEDADGAKSHFKDSQFLVLVNRVLALALSGAYLLVRGQPRHAAPLYKYAHCSFSNVMSSWCQYEALKFVSFPTQVLAKASKIIPVMVMGKLVSRAKYEYYEYVTALLLSLGMTLFMFGSGGSEDRHAGAVTTVSGLLLLAFYLVFDSFTSNWQGALFSQYKMSSVQMMCCVNLFSCLFTSVSLLPQGGFVTSLGFMSRFPKFALDCLVLSVCSAVGQLFVYFTISKFGAVVFTIMMTIRQGLAILLSCLIYHHHVSAVGVLGVVLVFFSIFLRVYCNQRLRAIRRKLQTSVAEKI